MARKPLSVVVTTLDNAATLERCLAGVAWADEIVVLDSGSTDATLEIARKYDARIFSEPFRGYSAQKQAAIDKASHDWVLLLDADEALGDGARAVIERALDESDSRRLPPAATRADVLDVPASLVVDQCASAPDRPAHAAA